MFLALLFFLVVAHALMDYALQNDTIAACKCRDSDHPVAKAVPWFYWLGAHAFLHGGAVGAVVRWFGYNWDVVVILAFAETVAHATIDYGKCGRWFGIHTDQLLHLACKVAWWSLLVRGVFPT